jgi:hypothetical protein
MAVFLFLRPTAKQHLGPANAAGRPYAAPASKPWAGRCSARKIDSEPHTLIETMTYFRSSTGALIDRPMEGVV